MKISKLPEATAVNDMDVVPIVQGGKTKRITRTTFVGTVPTDLQIKDNRLQLTANDEAFGNGVEIPKGYELLNDITLTEDVNEVMRTKDDNGNALNLRKFLLVFSGEFTADVSFPLLARFNYGAIYLCYKTMTFSGSSTNKSFWVEAEKYGDGVVRSTYSTSFINGTTITDGVIRNQGLNSSAVSTQSNLFMGYPAQTVNDKTISSWHFGALSTSGVQMLAGSRIIVLGVRE